jgi:hypothetical protein
VQFRLTVAAHGGGGVAQIERKANIARLCTY